MPEDTAYRGPPCEECRARRDVAASMSPFVPSRERSCPECQNESVTMWQVVCRGSGDFLIEKGFWLFRWWRRRSFTCSVGPSPKHFHLGCRQCNHRWKMLTATEARPAE